MNTEQRLIDMTLGDLLAILDERDTERRERERRDSQEPATVYGLEGLCQIFHCSKATAYRLKQSGKINSAITMTGKRKFAVNVSKAKQAMAIN